jgi:spore coat protein H
MKLLCCLLTLLGLAPFSTNAATGVPANQPVKHPPTAVANLPVVFLQTTQQINAASAIPCSVSLAVPDGAKANTAKPVTAQIRIHGSTSQSYPKKSFALVLESPARWLGMKAGTHWVLNAAAVDRSLMRHKLSYDLFLSLATTNAPRYAASSRFVEVDLNGRYQGVYLLMQRVDGALLNFRPFDRNDPSHGCLYKAIDHAADFSQPNGAGFDQREPDPGACQYWKPLEDFNRFVSQAKTEDFFHAQTGIGSRLDVANAVDFHLLVLLTSNMDGNDKNFMFGRDAQTQAAPNPRFFFAPWDYDATFGRNWEASRVGSTAWLSNHLLDRLLANRAYREQFAARWRQLRAREFSTATLERLIDENVRTLGPAAQRNAARWTSLADRYPDSLTFDQDVRQMKEWVAARTRWLDGEISRRCSAQTQAR